MIKNGNATEKLQDKNLQAPQAAYIIKSSFCMPWSLKGKIFYISRRIYSRISKYHYDRPNIKYEISKTQN